jgi:hypothetical protein
MFGLGNKDKDGKQVRIEHRGKYTRASRTGGVALRAEKKLGPINATATATANTSTGIRLSSRVAQGTRVALQNGKFHLIGRWNTGPLGFNLSKTGMSASVKNRAGTFNFIKPQYSSFKLAGIQLRGKKAAQIQLIYMSIMAAVFLAVFGVRILVFLAWMLWLPFAFMIDFVTGFIRGVSGSENRRPEVTE